MFESGPRLFDLDSLLEICQTSGASSSLDQDISIDQTSNDIPLTLKVEVQQEVVSQIEQQPQRTSTVVLDFQGFSQVLEQQVVQEKISVPNLQFDVTSSVPNINVSRKEDQIIWL